MIGTNGGLHGAKRSTILDTTTGIWTPNEKSNIKNRPLGDPYYNQVSLLLHFDDPDNPWKDSGPLNLTPTATGNVNRNSSIYAVSSATTNGSARFDGSGDWITYAPTDALLFNYGDFTVECFFRLNYLPANVYGEDSMIIFGNSFGGSEPLRMGIGYNSFGCNQAAYGVSTGETWVTGAWYHAAFCRNGTTARLFLNGALRATASWPWRDFSHANDEIGCQGNGGAYGNRCFNGWLDEIRITKGVSRYSNSFTVPTAPYPDKL